MFFKKYKFFPFKNLNIILELSKFSIILYTSKKQPNPKK